MKTPIIPLLLSALLLTGCASKLNPLNWFKPKAEKETLAELVDPDVIIDHRGMIDQVVALTVEKTSGGVIVHAVGLPITQGFWDAELIAENGERPINGVLVYQFRIEKPLEDEQQSTRQSREVVVGHFVSNFKLKEVRQIRVVAAQNARTARR